MQAVADQVVDEDSNLRNAQGLIHAGKDFVGFQMVSEKTARDNIETRTTKRECQRISNDAALISIQVDGYSIQKGHVQLNAGCCQNLAGGNGHCAQASTNFQQAKT